MKCAVEGVGGELGGVALGGGEAADGGVNGVDVDQSGIEDRRSVDHLRHGRGGSPRSPASLGVEGDRVDPTSVGNSEGDSR